MNKLGKLSLVAAATIACLNANAKDLSEAIKNVDVSGTVAYRYNDRADTNKNNGTAAGNGQNNNQYKAAINLTSKVNDDIALVTRVIATSSANQNSGEVASFDTTTKSDENLGLYLSEVNFVYTGVKDTSITLGKQAINSPFTMARDSFGNEQTGTGAVATYSNDMISAYAGYFNQTNITQIGAADAAAIPTGAAGTTDDAIHGSNDYVIAGVAGTFGVATIDASYIDSIDAFDGYTVGLSAAYKVGNVKLAPYARYTSLSVDSNKLENDSLNKDNSLWKVGLKANMGIFGAYIAYGETDKDGGQVALDGSATTGFDEHWTVTLTGISDASVLYAAVDAQVTDKINLALKYSDMDTSATSAYYAGGDIVADQSEVYVQGVYQMSPNFMTYVRFGQKDVDGNSEDQTIGRLHMQYSF